MQGNRNGLVFFECIRLTQQFQKIGPGAVLSFAKAAHSIIVPGIGHSHYIGVSGTCLDAGKLMQDMSVPMAHLLVMPSFQTPAMACIIDSDPDIIHGRRLLISKRTCLQFHRRKRQTQRNLGRQPLGPFFNIAEIFRLTCPQSKACRQKKRHGLQTVQPPQQRQIKIFMAIPFHVLFHI